MPRRKNWSPISHDFNHDPEVIELRHKFGDWMALVWQEMLHIADRNDGVIRGNLDFICDVLQRIYLSKSKRYNTEYRANRVRIGIEWMSNRHWIGIDKDSITILNYWKYHKRREPELPSTNPNSSYLRENDKNHSLSSTLVDDSDLFSNNHKDETLTVKDIVDSWNDSFAELGLSAVQWPINDSRYRKVTARLHEHPDQQFWQHVFDNIASSEFLLGRKTDWRCTFDFVFSNSTNPNKIWEGQYNGKKTQG